jgi:hypothetical protein
MGSTSKNINKKVNVCKWRLLFFFKFNVIIYFAKISITKKHFYKIACVIVIYLTAGMGIPFDL